MPEIYENTNFIKEAIEEDLKSGRFTTVHTRFPPEPNGYLHIGHAKAICIDFGMAQAFGGKTNLRYDDTNPVKEDTEYVDAIKEDIRWLGFDWDNREYYASDYFEQLYQWAEQLILQGDAYVDDLSPEEIRQYRGTLTEPGKNSPYRDRSVDENLDLFRRMRNGEFPDGARVLRAKIDMTSGNINMRDPVMYRILHASHHRTGDKWCIYPMYDFAHGQSDSIEGITHSLCDLAYEAHRPLYDWFVEKLGIFHPRQLEFSRLNISYTILSKRFLKLMVDNKLVNGWDDPRMPTLCGMRRRGFTSEAIRDFIDKVGVAKNESVVDISLLEHCVRDNLNVSANRVMAVLNPLKLIIDNYPEDQVEQLEAINNPEDDSAGKRLVPFSKVLFIEKDDFMENPPKKYFRLSPGNEVRLRYGYYVKCTHIVKDDNGEILEVHCTYDPETRGGYSPDGRKVKGTIHWVSAQHALEAEIRLYDRLFNTPDPDNTEEGKTFLDNLNPDSLTILNSCKVEPSLKNSLSGDRFQFERQGYFCTDLDSTQNSLVFNRTVSLKDSWAKISQFS
ncbi:MAG: glutamine--tRNA ligase [Chloroflexi bacterium HGW-Chloroflexi-2]|jgi:glutaminyl-tRNA synthetase|nr:MAG: glutamine--tRNA ligase [Chloroflexi bacterium HGW-Chloroflexi-2]